MVFLKKHFCSHKKKSGCGLCPQPFRRTRSRPIPASIGFWFSRDKCQDEKSPRMRFCALRYFFSHKHIKGLLRAVFCVLRVFKGLVLNFYRCDAFIFDFGAFLLLRSSQNYIGWKLAVFPIVSPRIPYKVFIGNIDITGACFVDI